MRKKSRRRLVIAIDGTAASGKSTLGQLLARQLGYLYFDTGALYRAVTWLALHKSLDINDERELARLAARARIRLEPPTVDDGRQYTVLVDDKDVTWQIREAEVDAHVSTVSAYPKVRLALLDVQRAIAKRGGVVMVGRDIASVVAPDADLKIYLDSSPEVRARRRWQELRARGVDADYKQVLEDVVNRDRLDSQRSVAPLSIDKDAVVINTDELSPEEELEVAVRLVEERVGSGTLG